MSLALSIILHLCSYYTHYVRLGLELARATLVNARGEVLYDRYVQPSASVIDYCTQYSGIEAHHLNGLKYGLADCQKDILTLIDADTYFVGHSLESDMRALR